MAKVMIPFETRTYGLHKRPTYDELLNYLAKDPDKIKLPNRRATFIRNSFEMSQLDGIGALQYGEYNKRMFLQRERDDLLHQFAIHHNLPLNDVIAYTSAAQLVPVKASEATSVEENDDAYETASEGESEAPKVPVLPHIKPQERMRRPYPSDLDSPENIAPELMPLGGVISTAPVEPSDEMAVLMKPMRKSEIRNMYIHGNTVAGTVRRMLGQPRHEIGLGTRPTPVHFMVMGSNKLTGQLLEGPEAERARKMAAVMAAAEEIELERMYSTRLDKAKAEAKTMLESTEPAGSREIHSMAQKRMAAMRRVRSAAADIERRVGYTPGSREFYREQLGIEVIPERKTARTQRKFTTEIPPPSSLLTGASSSSSGVMAQPSSPKAREGTPPPQPSPAILQPTKKPRGRPARATSRQPVDQQ